MIKNFLFFFISLFLMNCSLNENSSIWNKKKENSKQTKNVRILVNDNKKIISEFNSKIKIELPKNEILNGVFHKKNNYGPQKYNGLLNKVENYKFSKFDETNHIDLKPLFLKKNFIIFDKKGTIINFDYNKKIIWKKNYYSKYEKKIGPKLNFALNKNNLIVTDNMAKFYLINLNNGNLVWSKKNDYPFNSEIKILNDKFFVIDLKNILRCFYIKDGSECWNLPTENTTVVSNSNNSLLIDNNEIIFNNSIGDITAVDISTGIIVWQIPTQSSDIINDTHNFKISKLVGDRKSIYFSNNKNEFYSIDIKNGSINWVTNIDSILTPIIMGNLIFTISEDGFFYVIEKNNGNILKINYIYKGYSLKKRKNITPVGFSISYNKLYLSNSDGKLIVIELNSGKISKNIKVSKKIISEPYIFNNNLFVIKNGSINQYD